MELNINGQILSSLVKIQIYDNKKSLGIDKWDYEIKKFYKIWD